MLDFAPFTVRTQLVYEILLLNKVLRNHLHSENLQKKKGGQTSQKALRVPFPLHEGEGSFQVVWTTDLEVDLERT